MSPMQPNNMGRMGGSQQRQQERMQERMQRRGGDDDRNDGRKMPMQGLGAAPYKPQVTSPMQGLSSAVPAYANMTPAQRAQQAQGALSPSPQQAQYGPSQGAEGSPMATPGQVAQGQKLAAAQLAAAGKMQATNGTFDPKLATQQAQQASAPAPGGFLGGALRSAGAAAPAPPKPAIGTMMKKGGAVKKSAPVKKMASGGSTSRATGYRGYGISKKV